MVSRAVTALVGVVASLAVSILLWLGFGFPFFFLVIPFVPFLFRRDRTEHERRKTCPECGFSTRNPGHTYCPRDGRRLRTGNGE